MLEHGKTRKFIPLVLADEDDYLKQNCFIERSVKEAVMGYPSHSKPGCSGRGRLWFPGSKSGSKGQSTHHGRRYSAGKLLWFLSSYKQFCLQRGKNEGTNAFEIILDHRFLYIVVK